MVDALEEARRILVERGLLVDARPDSRVTARVRRGTAKGAILGTIGTQRPTKADDTRSDRAVAEVLSRGLFSSLRRGRVWHAIPFEDVRELQDYVDDHLRFSRRGRWRAPPSGRRCPRFRPRPGRFLVVQGR